MSKWYTKYPYYPEYCTTPDQMNTRNIPPLQVPYGIKSQLIHVTAVIRHGARAPHADKCWSGWNEQKWNCELKTFISPPPEPDMLVLEGVTTNVSNVDRRSAMFLFEKHYDAFETSPTFSNILNGTCEVGQLLLRGYVQEKFNGEMLRKIYTRQKGANNNRNNSSSDNMVLFDFNQESEYRPYEEPALFFRSDDEQRTMMSGQVLLRGLFGDIIQQHAEELKVPQGDPVIVVHTTDSEQNIFDPNIDLCPRLQALYDEAVLSKGYQDRFVKSKERKMMQTLMEKDLGIEKKDFETFQSSAQDCMMTAICNDHMLPPILDDFRTGNGGGGRNFEQMRNFVSIYFQAAILSIGSCSN